jgi:molybdopterin/thiamine biosynthesis adenylyltransferase
MSSGDRKKTLVPRRYLQNIGALSPREQFRLMESHVLVIGLGGLGGYAIESLARLGVGHITGVDKDVFEETNLNRQLLSETGNLGKNKAGAARQRLRRINPNIAFTAIAADFESLGIETFRSCRLVFDCLDNIPGRRRLARRCAEAAVTMVHGAIAGWCGQIAVCPPKSQLLEKIYAEARRPYGEEIKSGSLVMTAAVTANLMVAAAIPILLGQPAKAGLHLFDLRGQILGRSYHVPKSPWLS